MPHIAPAFDQRIERSSECAALITHRFAYAPERTFGESQGGGERPERLTSKCERINLDAMSMLQRLHLTRMAVIAFVLPGVLTACHGDDATFGRSYDACILKNASKGGDEESRSAATDICARHFLRAATDREAHATTGFVTIAFGTHAVQAREAKTFDPYNVADAEPQSADSMSADVTNGDDNAIVKEVEVDAYFHSGPPNGTDGRWKSGDPVQHITWTLQSSIDPHGESTLTGSFDGDRAPSKFYRADVQATMVVPQSDKPPSRLKETDR